VEIAIEIATVAHPRDATPERRSPDHLAMTGLRFERWSPDLKRAVEKPVFGTSFIFTVVTFQFDWVLVAKIHSYAMRF
jgi:hypothetical protein